MAVRRAVVQDQTYGFYEEILNSDSLQAGLFLAIGVGGIGVDAGSNRVTNVATPTADTDAANRRFVLDNIEGLRTKAACRLKTTATMTGWTAAGSGVGATLTSPDDSVANNDFDSVTAALGNRILVTHAVSAADNGIYTVTQLANGAGDSTILTRAIDFDETSGSFPEVVTNAYTFIEEGTLYADTGWVMTTNAPIVLETTALNWAQFTGLGSITAGKGLDKTGSTLFVELDTAADAQGAGNGGGSSGLEFDVAGDAGKLRAAVHATGGINRAAGGLLIELDPTANTEGNNPSAATAAAGLSVLRAPKVENNVTVNSAVTAGDPLQPSTTSGKFKKSRADTNADSFPFGVARTAAAADGDTVGLVTEGPAEGVIAGATPGDHYYLGATGGITSTIPGAGNRIIDMGMALTATLLYVKVRDFGKKAAA